MEEEEGGVVNPFANIEKSSVMQESRKFNAMPIKPRECSLILAKIMYIPIFLFFWENTSQGGRGGDKYGSSLPLRLPLLLRELVFFAPLYVLPFVSAGVQAAQPAMLYIC